MALSATMFRFEIDLSDVDRGVYETLELRAAQHPSESDAYFVTRVLALVLEHREGIAFGRGISVPDDPAICVSDLTGGYELWIEIGQPSGDRLHKITKQAARVCVYTHKNPEPILADLDSGAVFRGDEVMLVAFAPEFIDQLAGCLGRKNAWGILRSEGMVYVTVGAETLQTTPRVRPASGSAER